jgi:hypothetical protein
MVVGQNACLPLCKPDPLNAIFVISCRLSIVNQSTNQSNLQKVIAGTATAGGDRALVLGDGAEDAEFGVEVFANVHDGGYVAAAVAVVGSGPDGHDGLLGEVVLGRGLLA